MSKPSRKAGRCIVAAMNSGVESEVLAALESAAEGASSEIVSKIIFRSTDWTKRCLMRLRDRDQVRNIGKNGMSRWYLPQHEEAVNAWYAAALSESVAKKRARKSRNKRLKRERATAAALAFMDLAPTRRIVQATQAEPIRKTGPASVWELAA